MFHTLKRLPRLLQWNGRTRSSRREEPLLRQLAHKHTLARLALAWLTTILITILAVAWGVPMRYRIGEVYPHDLRARVEFTVINHVELINQDKKPVGGLVVHEKANHSDRPVLEKYPRGMLLVPRG